MGFNTADKLTATSTTLTNLNIDSIGLDDIIEALQIDDSSLTLQEAINVAKTFNEAQISGVLLFNLIKEQVEQPNFGMHTLEAIYVLTQKSLGLEVNLDSELDINQAFELVSGLDEAQIRGVLHYELKKEQVNSANFGWYTLLALSFLKQKYPNLDYKAIFPKVDRLNESQIKGFLSFKLDIIDVETRNFGWHTLKAIEKITRESKNKISFKEAFKLVSGLDKYQAIGVSEYGLKKKQVEIATFGKHTLWGMDILKKKNPNLDNQAAFSKVSRFTKSQIKGLFRYKLYESQVDSEHFGGHTIKGMLSIQAENPNLDNQAAFKEVSLFTKSQINGIFKYGLTKKQVKTPNFGMHILKAIKQLVIKKVVSNYRDAFKMVSGLKRSQVIGLFNYCLSREQVETMNFGFHTLKAIDCLMGEIRGLNYNNAFKMVSGCNQEQVLQVLKDKNCLEESYFNALLSSPALDDMMVSINEDKKEGRQPSNKRTRNLRDNTKSNLDNKSSAKKRVRFR